MTLNLISMRESYFQSLKLVATTLMNSLKKTKRMMLTLILPPTETLIVIKVLVELKNLLTPRKLEMTNPSLKQSGPFLALKLKRSLRRRIKLLCL